MQTSLLRVWYIYYFTYIYHYFTHINRIISLLKVWYIYPITWLFFSSRFDTFIVSEDYFTPPQRIRPKVQFLAKSRRRPVCCNLYFSISPKFLNLDFSCHSILFPVPGLIFFFPTPDTRNPAKEIKWSIKLQNSPCAAFPTNFNSSADQNFAIARIHRSTIMITHKLYRIAFALCKGRLISPKRVFSWLWKASFGQTWWMHVIRIWDFKF